MTTATQILETVVSLAKEAPYTRAECRYFNEDKTPCCIVGGAFEKHGITHDTFVEISERGERSYEDLNQWTGISCDIFGYVGVEVDSQDALDKLAEIQIAQDTGSSWKEAVEDAGLLD